MTCGKAAAPRDGETVSVIACRTGASAPLVHHWSAAIRSARVCTRFDDDQFDVSFFMLAVVLFLPMDCSRTRCVTPGTGRRPDA
jgi:hypothetical protein